MGVRFGLGDLTNGTVPGQLRFHGGQIFVNGIGASQFGVAFNIPLGGDGDDKPEFDSFNSLATRYTFAF